jgi:hypothetical protein
LDRVVSGQSPATAGDRANKVKLRAKLNTEEVEMGADQLAMEMEQVKPHFVLAQSSFPPHLVRTYKALQRLIFARRPAETNWTGRRTGNQRSSPYG